MPHPLLYELNTRCWLQELSCSTNRPVTLATVPDSEFDRWERLGFTHLWLMGVWTTGPRSRACALAPEMWRGYREALPDCRESDVPGSPYAVADYRVPEHLGGESGLQLFRKRLHHRGMKLLLDFVPNHVGLDHRWVMEWPSLFVQTKSETPGTFRQETRDAVCWLAHGRDPYFLPWTDTVQLDYRKPATRSAMRELLLSIAARCDGVRCDMAMLLLNEVFARTWSRMPADGPPPSSEFWEEAVRATKRACPEFLFLAEVYWGLEERLRTLGFDYAYGKDLYDELVRRNPPGVQHHLLRAPIESVCASAHFLENHDEQRIASVLSFEEHRAAALMMLSLPGMRFLHDGQLRGARIRVPVQLARRPLENCQADIKGMYEQMLTALQNTAVGRGKARIPRPQEAWPGNPSAQNIIVAQWQSEPPDFDLAAINLAPHRSQCYVPLGIENLEQHEWILKDRLGTEEHRRSGKDLRAQGIYLDLDPHAAQLFHFQPAVSSETRAPRLRPAGTVQAGS